MVLLSFVVLFLLSLFQITIQLNKTALNSTTNCVQNSRTLAKLDIATESLEKVKDLFPNCGKRNDSSECSTTAKALEYLDIALSLTTQAKKTVQTCSSSDKQYSDCSDIRNSGQNSSGVYTVWPKTRIFPHNRTVQVFCDMDTDEGGWNVIQRRGNFFKQENFYRDWEDYKNGFGKKTEDFWLGNDNIFALSNQGHYQIRFDMEDTKGTKGYAVYDNFYIEDETKRYVLHIGGYSGNLGDGGDSMRMHDNTTFATKDRDNDRRCSNEYRGGWWYDERHCYGVNANGVYERSSRHFVNVVWNDWREKENLDKLEIKIKRK